MRARAALLGVLVAGGLVACGGDDGPDPWTLEVTGTTVVERDGDARELDGGSHKVEAGDRVEVVDGRAVLALPDDAALELRSGVGRADDSVLRVGDTPELLDGELLLVGAQESTAVTAGAAEVSVAEGALRVRRGASVTVGVYRGSPTLTARGRDVDGLRPLRQATITDSGSLPRELQPVSYDANAPDPWDKRFLGDAIDLDVQIELRRAAVAQGAPRTDLLPVVRELAGDVPIDPARSVTETVVGAAIAGAGDDDEVATRWLETFAFRDAGAPWGVVALDQQADRGEVLGGLDDVVRRLRQRFGGVAAGTGGGGIDVAIGGDVLGGGEGTTPSTGGGGGGSGGDGGGGGGGGSQPTPTVPPVGGSPEVPSTPGLPLPDLPIVGDLPLPDDGGDPDPEPPPPSGGGTGTVGEVVGGVTQPVVEVVEEVPVVGDVVEDLLADPLGDVLDGVTGGLLGG